MSRNPTVIYSARSAQHAHLLKNLLAEDGIEAVVLNEELSGGRGVDAVGWATAAQVAVDERDAETARRIALEFDRHGHQSHAEPFAADRPEPAKVLDAWPQCPECEAKRTTRCPICGTSGSDFAPVDMGFVWVPGEFDAAAPSCGPGGCSSGACASHGAAADADADAPQGDEPLPEDSGTLVMCHTCDEPFKPDYPRVCEWCGHEFDDGYDLELPDTPVEQIDSRAILVIVVLGVLAASAMAWFMFIL